MSYREENLQRLSRKLKTGDCDAGGKIVVSACSDLKMNHERRTEQGRRLLKEKILNRI